MVRRDSSKLYQRTSETSRPKEDRRLFGELFTGLQRATHFMAMFE
jgi:hypothetical protein